MEDQERFKREVLGVSIILVLGTILIIYPFLDAIVLAVATSYLLRHAHRRLNDRLANEFLSSVVITTSIVGIITLGVFMFISNFDYVLGMLKFFAFDLQQNIQGIVETLNLPDTYNKSAEQYIGAAVQNVKAWLESSIASVPVVVINVGIYLVTAIYLYRDGERIKQRLFDFAESLSENEEKIVKSLIRSTDSIFRGVFITQLMVATILAVVAGIGFYIIGLITSPIPFAVFWSLLIGIAALLPLVAAFMFYGPIGAFYIFTGAPLKGFLILGFGAVFLNILPEMFLRPFVGSRQMDEHPLIIFLGFLAGPLTLGLKGIVLGPVILILSKEFFLNYSELVSEPES
ncbi:MAG: AI-2E family transporter [Candidatus Nanohaloarchaea archaeon]